MNLVLSGGVTSTRRSETRFSTSPEEGIGSDYFFFFAVFFFATVAFFLAGAFFLDLDAVCFAAISTSFYFDRNPADAYPPFLRRDAVFKIVFTRVAPPMSRETGVLKKTF